MVMCVQNEPLVCVQQGMYTRAGVGSSTTNTVEVIR